LSTFILAFGFFLLMSLAMGLGYILQRKVYRVHVAALVLLVLKKHVIALNPAIAKKRV